MLRDIRNLAQRRRVQPRRRTGAAGRRLLQVSPPVIQHRRGGAARSVRARRPHHARQTILPRLRARNQVEPVIKVFLVASSSIAILTTIGIILSLVFEPCASSPRLAGGLSVRPEVEPADRAARRPGGRLRSLRRSAAVRRHAADRVHRHAAWRCRSACSRPSTWRSMPTRGCVRWPSRCWKSSPASRRWSTASSPR